VELERLLRSQGFGSRPDCRALVRQGRISIGGEVCEDPYAEFDPAGLEFIVDGVSWLYRDKVYLALHKPGGYECSHQVRHHPSVYELLPKPLLTRDVQSVGRLDEDTTGLLLFSDDGQFIHTYTSPKKHVTKLYRVTTKHRVDARQIAELLAGVQLHDEPAPIAAAACAQTGEYELALTVTEGKYHLVKRMIAAVSNRVEALHRSAIGGLTLPADLLIGQWRFLDAGQISVLAGRG
jgi:16S rRNA pseudouridine516 synthase